MSGCKKYGEWLADAALGTLPPRRERELLAHACECDTCREAYEHARDVVVLIDRGVESFVSGQPSPDFEARLRARIADQPRRFTPWVWKPAITAAFAVALITVILVAHERPRLPSYDLAVNAGSHAGLDRRPVMSQPPDSASGQPVARTRPLPTSAFRPHPASRHFRAPSQPEVLVEPGQLGAIIRFAKAVSAGRIDGKALLAAQQRADAPLEIEPLKIGPLEPFESDGISGTSEGSGRH